MQREKEEAESEKAKEVEKVFKMSNINLEIPRGKLVAIVGPVGSGKTSLLQALIGEVRRTSGKLPSEDPLVIALRVHGFRQVEFGIHSIS